MKFSRISATNAAVTSLPLIAVNTSSFLVTNCLSTATSRDAILLKRRKPKPDEDVHGSRSYGQP